MPDKRYFKCPECNIVSNGDDWDKATDSAGNKRKYTPPIGCKGKLNYEIYNYVCDVCGAEVNGAKIKEPFGLKPPGNYLAADFSGNKTVKPESTYASFVEAEYGVEIPEPLHEPDNFDVFIDRVESLVERWKTFHEKNRDFDGIANQCMAGFLSEMKEEGE